ncbi:AGE family epimerase/isomerase [Salininema proteolyticum]|uniref:AGE family epimerase/isomerase n=1 Tax=Salininema proteolyticum TaxID=1607685 RepID=A0ABV8TU61_9ACTN
MTPRPGTPAWLSAEYDRLMSFGADGDPGSYLDDRGRTDTRSSTFTWIAARMTHVHSLGAIRGRDAGRAYAQAALDKLRTDLHDDRHGGWHPAIRPDGTAEAGKSCYDHAFVMLAASSALTAGLEGAQQLLTESASVYLDKFWDASVGRPRDAWDSSFSTCEEYRGLNSTMHSVEALLAVADTVEISKTPAMSELGGGAEAWRERARTACEFVIDLARAHGNRLPEHFDASWSADLEYNSDKQDDPFKPYGATPGHGFEWARLLLHAEATGEPDDRTLAAAVALFDQARKAWGADGHDGFVYTTDWDDRPVVTRRMHWVAVEAINTAYALHERTGDSSYGDLYDEWWAYAADAFIDAENGSWHHELAPDGTPEATVWPGKPDLYHTVQATLLPVAGLKRSFARALRQTEGS